MRATAMMPFVPWTPRPATAAGHDDDDATLAARVARGDAAALEMVYRREAGPVYRFLFALSGGNAGWAADATQEAFTRFATRPEAFDAGRAALGAYLAEAGRHALLALWREAPLPALEDDDGEAADGGAEDASPEALLVRRQSQQALWAALRALAWPMREAVVLVDLQERSYEEAAAIAGIELNTLRTRLHRARRQLARRLNAVPARDEQGR